jgi:hypothetical protein
MIQRDGFLATPRIQFLGLPFHNVHQWLTALSKQVYNYFQCVLGGRGSSESAA